ncbi:MAG: hypothetical protein ACRDD7_09375 [Peptostreptococcaceae bacterium]
MKLLISFFVGLLLLPVIEEVKYNLMFEDWKKRIFCINFIKDIFDNIKRKCYE